MVRVVAGVEVVMVQGAVKPVVEELHGAGVEEGGQHQPLGVPPRRRLRHRHHRVYCVEKQRRQDDLVVPAACVQVDIAETQVNFIIFKVLNSRLIRHLAFYICPKTGYSWLVGYSA